MELFGVPGELIVQGGASALLLFVGLLVILGFLPSRRELRDVRADRDARLREEKARGDEWRAVAKAQDERNDVLAAQLVELLEVGRTTNAFIDGLRRAATEERRS